MATLVRTANIVLIDETTSAQYDNAGTATPGPQPYILSASCEYGYDIHVASAKIVFHTFPQGFNYWDVVNLQLGVTGGGGSGPVTRFRGVVTLITYSLYAPTVTVECKGFLVFAQQYQNNAGPTVDAPNGGTNLFGAGLTDGPASATSSTTDCIVKKALTQCGVQSAWWQGDGSGHYLITGTGQVLGTLAVQDFLWAQDESGLSYIQRIEEVALGYRTYDQLGGYVTRQMVDTRIPMSPSPVDATFTEGVDILSGTSPRSVLPVRNQIVVQGWTDPSGTTLGKTVQGSSSYIPTPPTYIPQDLTSRLLERSNAADIPTTDGISCEDAGNWLLGQLNQLQVKLDLETYRDDLLYPGHFIQVNSTGQTGLGAGLDLANTYLWLQHVTVTVAEDGAFTQKVTGLRGAA